MDIIRKNRDYNNTKTKLDNCLNGYFFNDYTDEEKAKFQNLKDMLTVDNSTDIYIQTKKLKKEIAKKEKRIRMYESVKNFIESNIDNPNYDDHIKTELTKYYTKVTIDNAKNISLEIRELVTASQKMWALFALIIAMIGLFLVGIGHLCYEDRILLMECKIVSNYLLSVGFASIFIGIIIMAGTGIIQS